MKCSDTSNAVEFAFMSTFKASFNYHSNYPTGARTRYFLCYFGMLPLGILPLGSSAARVWGSVLTIQGNSPLLVAVPFTIRVPWSLPGLVSWLTLPQHRLFLARPGIASPRHVMSPKKTLQGLLAGPSPRHMCRGGGCRLIQCTVLCEKH